MKCPCVTLPLFCVVHGSRCLWRRPVVTLIIESMGCRGGNVLDKRNVVVESMGCRRGENFDKSNVFDKRNVVVESMGCRGGGKL